MNERVGTAGRSRRGAVMRRPARHSKPVMFQDRYGQWWLNLEELYRTMWIAPADIDRRRGSC